MAIALQFASLYDRQEIFLWSNCLLDLGTDLLVGNKVFCMRCVVSCGNRKMDVTRKRISRIFELREILLSFQTGFSLVNAAVVCAIMETSSGLEPLADTTEPRYLKLVPVLS